MTNRVDHQYGSAPNAGFIIDGYNTKNLNKAAYLLMKGSRYVDVITDERGIGQIFLDNVNRRHVDEYWKEDMILEFWTFDRQRKFLKTEISKKSNE